MNFILDESACTHLDLAPVLRNDSFYYETDDLTQLLNSSQNYLAIANLNVQSLNAKFTSLEILNDLLAKDARTFDVICLQETWLTSDAVASLLRLAGYTLILHGAPNSRHRGVGMYIKSPLTYIVRPESIITPLWEALFVEITHPNFDKPIIIGSIYRPPSQLVADKTTFIEEFSECINSFQPLNKHIMIAGDFNLNLLKIKTDDNSNQFYNCLSTAGYEPLITFPTRFSEHNCSLIDNIFYRSTSLLDPTSGILTSPISDHQLCFSLFSINKTPSSYGDNNIQYQTITKKPHNYYELITADFSNLNIMDSMNPDLNSDPTPNYVILETKLTDLINKHTETKTVKFRKHRHKKTPWITQGIVKSIKFRDKLHLKLKKSPLNSAEYNNNKLNLAVYNKILKKTIKSAKKLHHTNLFQQHKNNPKETWKHLNSLLGRKQSTEVPIEQININDITTRDPSEICNQFNQFFTKIGHETASNIPRANHDFQSYLTPNNYTQFHFRPINITETENLINSLKPKHSTGQDNINTILLKRLKHELASPLTLIANQMLSSSTFPNPLKIAKVKPLHKKDDREVCNNYRPISLLPSISKILEKVILKQLIEYFTDNNILYTSQYGFRKKRSTEHAILELTDTILKHMDQNVTPTTIFLDLSKAFDTLDHHILLHKLKHYGLNDSALKLCKNYLSERKQYVQLNETKSSQLDISIGVPQGSILGPFFFLIFVNDLPNCSNLLKFITYADDTTLISTINPQSTDNISLLNTELNKVYTWLCTNKLSLNISKTKSITFHTPQRKVTPPVITINSQKIDKSDTFNFLGITLDKHMSWKAHINKIKNKISQTIGALNNLRNLLPKAALMHIYNALITPHLNYGILAWGKSNHVNQILKIQKRAVRVISNAKYNAHTEPLFKNLGILKIEDMRKLFEVKFYYNFSAGLLPEYFSTFTQTNLEFHTAHQTRGRRQLSVPVHRHHFVRSGLRYTIVSTINNCPDHILQKIDTHCIRTVAEHYKNFVLESYQVICTIPNCYICG